MTPSAQTANMSERRMAALGAKPAKPGRTFALGPLQLHGDAVWILGETLADAGSRERAWALCSGRFSLSSRASAGSSSSKAKATWSIALSAFCAASETRFRWTAGLAPS